MPACLVQTPLPYSFFSAGHLARSCPVWLAPGSPRLRFPIRGIELSGEALIVHGVVFLSPFTLCVISHSK